MATISRRSPTLRLGEDLIPDAACSHTRLTGALPLSRPVRSLNITPASGEIESLIPPTRLRYIGAFKVSHLHIKHRYGGWRASSTQACDATANFILQLHNRDIEELLHASKSKGRHGEPLDADLAIAAYQQELQERNTVLADLCMARSLTQAVISDAALLRKSLAEKDIAIKDRALAHRLAGINAPSAAPEQKTAGYTLDDGFWQDWRRFMSLARTTKVTLRRIRRMLTGQGPQSHQLGQHQDRHP